MKGVIVSVGEPKSVVLLNNGKFSSVRTPDGAHVGMVVSIRLNNRIRILVAAASAAVLIAIGVTIGALFLRNGHEERQHGQYQSQQDDQRASQNHSDISGYSFQNGKPDGAAGGM